MGELRRPWYTVKMTNPETGEVHTERRQSEVWWIRYYRNGKRHEESSGTTSKTAAKNLLAQREGDKAKGLPVSAKVGRLTFDQAAQAVVDDYVVNGKRTAAQVERRLKLHLLPYFGSWRMSNVTTDVVRAYQKHRQGERATNATINREVAILRRAFRLAYEAGTVLHRPSIPMLKESNTRTGFFERADFEAVRAEMPEHLRPFVTFLYFTGWRTGEVMPLQWAQVDRGAEVVRLEPGSTKNGKGRELPYALLPELVEVVERQWAQHCRLAAAGTLCPFVFPHRDGSPVRDCRKSWQAACEHAGVPGRLLHDFRRTAARNLVRAGVSQKVAMEVTGHLTPSVFSRYDITGGDDVRQALGKLAAGAAGKEKGKAAASGRLSRFPVSR